MFFGNMPNDDGNFLLTESEKDYFVEKYPQDKKFIKVYVGGDEFFSLNVQSECN